MSKRFGLTALHSILGLEKSMSLEATKSFDFTEVQYLQDALIGGFSILTADENLVIKN